jgi:hypothetical protein
MLGRGPVTKRRRGGTLVTAMGVLMTVSLLGVSVLGLSTHSARLAYHRRNIQLAFNLAEGGLREGLYRLGTDATYLGQGNTTLGDGQFRVEVSIPAGQPTMRQVVGVGRVQSLGGTYFERKVMALALIGSTSYPLFDYGIISDKDLYFSGDQALKINVHSNRDITISGKPTIDGNLTAVGIISAPDATVKGTKDDNAPPFPFPTLDTIKLLAEAKAAGIKTGDTSFSGGETKIVTLKGYYGGKVDVGGVGRIFISGTVYITGEAVLKADQIVGDGVLVCEKKVDIGDNGKKYTASLPSTNCVIASIHGKTDPGQIAINISGNVTIKGALYAQHATAYSSGNTQINAGGIAAQYVTVSGNLQVVKSGPFEAPSSLSSAGVMVKYWQEL